MARTLLVTGGAGFIGSSLAIAFKARRLADRVLAFDSLRRRGSELNLGRLAAAGVEFRHGDVRSAADLDACGGADLILECSADPSVAAGRDGDARFVVDTNLVGCVNCLELARRTGAALVLLSTSRVYPTAALSAVRYEARGDRFHLLDGQPLAGVSARGIAETFPLEGPRTLYGATKLAAELLVAEYADMYGVRAIVNRCGVVAGPWQMGRSEQGVFAHWLLAHALGRPLAYVGYGGRGLQVRDILHVDDLVDLVEAELGHEDAWTGAAFNAGGGLANSVSLRELTALAEAVTGARLDIASQPATRPGDVPLYITDHARASARFGWQPSRGVERTARDVYAWIAGHAAELAAALG
jgi:CDP-paratose 2-epimerase